MFWPQIVFSNEKFSTGRRLIWKDLFRYLNFKLFEDWKLFHDYFCLRPKANATVPFPFWTIVIHKESNKIKLKVAIWTTEPGKSIINHCCLYGFDSTIFGNYWKLQKRSMIHTLRNFTHDHSQPNSPLEMYLFFLSQTNLSKRKFFLVCRSFVSPLKYLDGADVQNEIENWIRQTLKQHGAKGQRRNLPFAPSPPPPSHLRLWGGYFAN